MPNADTPAPAAALAPARTRPAVRPVVLLILDGFGCRADAPDNAITRAAMPHWNRAARHLPAHDDRRLRAARRPAGGPDGQLRGRPPEHRRRPRHLPGLHAHRPSRSRRRVRAQPGAAPTPWPRPRATARALHVLGLLSPGGVHSHERQIAAMVDMAAARGRDARLRARVPRRPRHAAAQRRARRSRSWTASARRHPARASRRICGRYYAMDRDQRWDRVAAGLRPAGRRHGAVHGGDAAAGPRRGLRPRRDRRVRAADRHPDAAGAPVRDGRRRRRRVHELPRRPRPRDDARAHRRRRSTASRAPAFRRSRASCASRTTATNSPHLPIGVRAAVDRATASANTRANAA